MSVLLSALRNPCSMRVPFFILQTLSLIRFYLISTGFKYTFVPNFATTWEVWERYFQHFRGNNLGLLSENFSARPNCFTRYPLKGWGVKEILCLTWPLAVLFLVIITEELLSEPTHELRYYSYNYSTSSWSASHCDKFKAEYTEALTFVTRHNRPF